MFIFKTFNYSYKIYFLFSFLQINPYFILETVIGLNLIYLARREEMNALARYLLVFLLGWSGAVWSYSDIIYKKEAPSKKIETPIQTNDISLPDSLKPKPEVDS